MTEKFTLNQFPSREEVEKAVWSPILFCPRPGSPEKLVIGVAAVNDHGFFLEEANAWRRLHCLFDDGAEPALLAVKVALDELRSDLAKRGTQALVDPRTSFSGVSIGSPKQTEGTSLKQISSLWLRTLSSLFDSKTAANVDLMEADDSLIAQVQLRKLDRLPMLVLEFVKDQRPGLAEFFRSDIREPSKKPNKARAQDVYIGYSGSRLAANFATLPPSRSKTTIDHIKRLMWDLEQDRDRQTRLQGNRHYEMIVKHQGKDDPHISESQYNGLLEVVDELGQQGRSKNIELVARVTVPEIGNHLLQFEASENVARLAM